MTEPSPPLATTLETATEALDFVRPLESGDARWRDLSPARGGDVGQIIKRYLTRVVPGRFRHIVFASHRGAGKSTELLRIAHDLSQQFLPLYLEANIEMDANSIEMEDLLLVLAQKVEATLREAGHPLSTEVLDRVNKWFCETIETTSVGKEYVAKVETEMKGGLDLVIIDNLDRYNPKIIDELLVRGGDRFRELRTNLILTPPTSLIYRPETGVLADYFHVEVMPSVRLRGPEDPYDALNGEGPRLLLNVLGGRIDLDLLIPEPQTRQRLVVASGGSIRELLHITSDATLLADGEQLTRADVERAIKRHRDRIRDTINANGWLNALVKIARNHQIGSDEAYLSVLHQRLAFKYNEEGWYDAHPLAYEIDEFQAAMTKRDSSEA